MVRVVRIYMCVCWAYVCKERTHEKKMVTYLGKKTHKAGKIASIRGKKPHVYRVIILKQKADYRHARDRGLLGSFYDCGHMINFR